MTEVEATAKYEILPYLESSLPVPRVLSNNFPQWSPIISKLWVSHNTVLLTKGVSAVFGLCPPYLFAQRPIINLLQFVALLKCNY